MSEHTKEPWMYPVQEDVGGPDDGWWIYNGEVGMKQYAVAVAPPYNPNAEADARRIVACVNALAGFPTKYIEGGDFILVSNADHSAKDARISALEESERRLRDVCSTLEDALDQIESETQDIAIQKIARCAISQYNAMIAEMKAAGIEVK